MSSNPSRPTNATITDGQGAGTITDGPRISVSDFTKAEGKKNQTILFTVKLSAAYDQPVTGVVPDRQ